MELTTLLAACAASDEFKGDLLGFIAGGSATRIHLARRAPSIKVLRVLTQLLHAEPSLVIERVTIDALSTCSAFDGRLDAHTAADIYHFDFRWDCQWRAEEEGWTDAFGFPDQIRAADEFGWRCFRTWRRAGITSAEPPTALVS